MISESTTLGELARELALDGLRVKHIVLYGSGVWVVTLQGMNLGHPYPSKRTAEGLGTTLAAAIEAACVEATRNP